MDKERQVERFLKQLKHLRTPEEEKRLKEESRARKATRRPRKPARSRDWFDEAAEDAPLVEKMTPSSARPRPAARAAAAPSATRSADAVDGVIVGVHRGRVTVRTEHDDVSALRPPRHHGGPSLAVGDEVWIAPRDDGFQVEGTQPRRTVLSRQDGADGKERVIAANVDLAVIVVAARRPALHPRLIDRLLVATDRGGVRPVVCVNKIDLVSEEVELEALRDVLEVYRDLAPVHLASAETGEGIGGLRETLRGATSVFVGSSGVGKSSLLNALDPAGTREIGRVRQGDGKGRHTTTSSELRSMPDGTCVIDSPGVRAFGLGAVNAARLALHFPDMRELVSSCRFKDCLHRDEPGCAVREAARTGALSRARYETYLRIMEGL